jgi:hypothetical protein
MENNVVLTDKENFTKAMEILINTALHYVNNNTSINISLKKQIKKFILEIIIYKLIQKITYFNKDIIYNL